MDEPEFLRAIQADPSDDALLLAYSDWLEERGDELSARKAEFLRVTVAATFLIIDTNRDLAVGLDDDWLALMNRREVVGCSGTFIPSPWKLFRVRCQRTWATLRTTADPLVRHCDDCQRPVHYCRDADDLLLHIDQRRCVSWKIRGIEGDGEEVELLGELI